MKVHTKIWSENLKKVEDNIKMKFKTGVMTCACAFCKKTFRLCNKNHVMTVGAANLTVRPWPVIARGWLRVCGMPFVRLVFAQRCGWVCWWVPRRNRQLRARWDWNLLTTRNKFRRSSGFPSITFRTRLMRWRCDRTLFIGQCLLDAEGVF